jgi:hypothetical protein
VHGIALQSINVFFQIQSVIVLIALPHPCLHINAPSMQVPKRGSHRCYVGTASPDGITVIGVELRKGTQGEGGTEGGTGGRSRVGEDYVCSRMTMDAIARACIVSPLPADYLFGGDGEGCNTCGDGNGDGGGDRGSAREPERVSLVETPRAAVDYVQRLLGGVSRSLLAVPHSPAGSDSTARISPGQGATFKYFEDVELPHGSIVFPGSFNPVHQGHVTFATTAARLLQDGAAAAAAAATETPPPLVVFEISIANADKPPLSIEEVLRRIDIFSQNVHLFETAGLQNYAICLTTMPLFLGKTAIFKGCKFLVGADTMIRLLNPKYYTNSASNMLVALASIADRQCSFLVAGRVEQHPDNPSSAAKFLTCDDVFEQAAATLPIQLPDAIASLFQGIPEDMFRSDISSTVIREKMKLQQAEVSR